MRANLPKISLIGLARGCVRSNEVASVRINVIANYLGQGWVALMGLAFVPIYIKYLGMEAYGLIGIFAVLQVSLTVLDMGMAPTLNREMARFTAGAHSPQSIWDLLRSLEVICFGIAMLIGMSVWGASAWLGGSWLRAEKLSIEAVVHAIAVMGFVVGLRFVEGLYRGAILGLQKQVWFNAVNAALATLRGIGAVSVLAWVSTTIEAFFLWQGVVSIITIAIFAVSVHRGLPDPDQPPRFSFLALSGIWRFASGIMATAFLVLLLTQMDKVLLSRLLSLEDFGYYAFAATIASMLYQLIVPVTQAFYPRFSELVTRGDTIGLVTAYHRGAQLVSVLIVPAALMLMMFGEDLLVMWTGDVTLARDAAPLVALLTLGTLLNGLMNIPYNLQLAYGWSGFAARVNMVGVAILVPAILWVTPRYGAVGAAWVWVVLNSAYVLITIHFMHHRLLPREKWNWYVADLGMPLIATLIVALVGFLLKPNQMGNLGLLCWIAGTGVMMLAAAGASANIIRRDMIAVIYR